MSSTSKEQAPPKGGVAAFLEKLYDMLSDKANESSICWQPSGESFIILNVTELQTQVLPKFFKHQNMNSFVRQLNMYDFRKVTHDPAHKEFRNPFFQRGRRDALVLIKRKVSANAATAPSPAPRSRALSATLPAADDADVDDEDGHNYGGEFDAATASPDDLRWRVGQLETKTWLLSERYSELSSKHDALCNMLSTILANGGAGVSAAAAAAAAAASSSTAASVVSVESSVAGGEDASAFVRMISIEATAGSASSRAGLLDLVDAATFAVVDRKPLSRQHSLDASASEAGHKRGVSGPGVDRLEGQKLSRVRTL